jgi:release factor glutamine methyltransferase
MSEVYLPSEDSLFLLQLIEKKKANKVVEIGTGSGFVLKEYSKTAFFDLGVATDIDIEAVRSARKRFVSDSRVEFILCEGCEAIRNSCLDFVFFNPPYLRGESEQDKTIFGGESGTEVTRKFVAESVRVLRVDGEIVFVLSSLADWRGLLSELKSDGLSIECIGIRKLFFERLLGFLVRQS